MKHWAAKYIGERWSDEHNCWWLMREACRVRWGDEMPDIGIGEVQVADNVTAIKRAAGSAGWRPVDGNAEEGDILLCRDAIGKRHVGMVIETQGKLRLLHSAGHMTERGPVGSVVAERLEDAIAGGISDIELWRRAA